MIFVYIIHTVPHSLIYGEFDCSSSNTLLYTCPHAVIHVKKSDQIYVF